MAAIHHNTLKKAGKFSIKLVVRNGKFAALASTGETLAVAVDAKDALDLAIANLKDGAGPRAKDSVIKPKKAKPASKAKTARKPALKCPECDAKWDGVTCEECGHTVEDDADGDEGEDGEETKSVVKHKYRQQYKPHKHTCGDALTHKIHAEFMTAVNPDTKKKRIDWKKFTAFAKKNECWSDDYLKLNNGMKRMNIVNRLRAKIDHGHEVIWN